MRVHTAHLVGEPFVQDSSGTVRTSARSQSRRAAIHHHCEALGMEEQEGHDEGGLKLEEHAGGA